MGFLAFSPPRWLFSCFSTTPTARRGKCHQGFFFHHRLSFLNQPFNYGQLFTQNSLLSRCLRHRRGRVSGKIGRALRVFPLVLINLVQVVRAFLPRLRIILLLLLHLELLKIGLRNRRILPAEQECQ